MSEQRTILSTSGERKITPEDMRKTAEEAKKLRAEKKARFARVLDRGFSVDRLTVELPPDLYGEWIPTDQVDRAELLGFRDGAEYANKRQLHAGADGKARVADVVFMVQDREEHE